MKGNIVKVNSKRAGKMDWKIDENLATILNGIDIIPEKRVMFTAGDRQYLSDDGKMYQIQTKNLFNSVPLSKMNFIQRTNEYMINQYTNRADIIIDL